MMRIRYAISRARVVRLSVLGHGVAIASTMFAVVAEEPPAGREPAIVVRAVRPDRQAAAVVELFSGARAPNPAAAMAAWRRATADISQIGKPLQAVAAFLNPQMIGEWKAFDDAEAAVGFESATGNPFWRVFAPVDDGTLSALITSLRLSGGENEPPVADPPVVVERLGGPGAAVGARLREGVAFAGHRADLVLAVDRLRARATRGNESDPKTSEPLALGANGSGFRLTFDPDRLAPPGGANLTLLRIATAARAGGVQTTVGLLALEDDHLDLNLSTKLDPERLRAAEGEQAILDPSWLTCVPAENAQAAVAIAFGRGTGFWNRIFEVADRVDRADPARAQLAPLRVRLNFLAMARGVRLEADLWPSLRGVTLAAVRRPGQAGGVLLALHSDRAEDAERILARVVRPFSALLGGGKVAESEGSKTVALGQVSDRPLEAAVRGSTVLIGWGDGTLDLGLRSLDRPEQSAAVVLGAAKADAGGRPTSRAGIYWPGRLVLPVRGFVLESPLNVTLSQGAPVVWQGGEEGGRAWDLVRWPDLRRLVARFLDRVPQAPPGTP